MARLRSLFFLVSALVPFGFRPALAEPPAEQSRASVLDIAVYVTEASRRFAVPESWIYAVVRTESGGRVAAVSPAGASGLMQLMPATWARQRARHGLGDDRFEPRDNILAGTSYLRELYDRYGLFGALAAYNAGPGRYEDWRDRGRPLPAETRAYVARVAALLQSPRSLAASGAALPAPRPRMPWTQSQLFVTRPGSVAAASTLPDGPGAGWPTGRPTLLAGDLFAPVSGGRLP